MSNKIEHRTLSGKLQLRAAPSGDDSPGILEGYAAVYNSDSQDLGGFIERIAPKAFDKVVASKDTDCRFLVNHDPNQILGRTKAGTLKLRSDGTGLWCSVQLPNTQLGRDIHESVSRGDMDQMSFSFRLDDGDDEWSDGLDANGKPTRFRTIRNFSGLYDVSSVTFPAYTATSVSARSSHYAISAPRTDEARRAEAARLGAVIANDTQTFHHERMSDADIVAAAREVRDEKAAAIQRNAVRNYGRRPVRG